MLNVTITSKYAHDEFLECVALKSFEKLSNLAFLYSELDNPQLSFEEGVRIYHTDVELEMQTQENGPWQLCKCPADIFENAMKWAINAVITFTIDTEFGIKSRSVAYFPGNMLPGDIPGVAWIEEPDYVILSSEDGEPSFVFFNDLLDFVMQDIDEGELESVTYEEDNHG